MIQKIQREESILLSLSKLDYLTRSQIQKLHDLGGDRNSRRVLHNMRDYISRFRDGTGEHVYYLNRAGRERIGCEVVRQKGLQVNHYLMRNDVYIKYRPQEWRNEMKLVVKDVLTVIPDAYFKAQQRLHFLEVDHLQSMSKNKDKISKYITLRDTNVFQERFGQFPKLMWVTLTESRKKQLAKWCEGLEHQIIIWEELK